MALAMLPEPMKLMVVMTCFSFVGRMIGSREACRRPAAGRRVR